MLCRTPFRRSAAELGGGVAAASARHERRLYVLISGMAALLSCAIWPLSRLTLCDPGLALFQSLPGRSRRIDDDPIELANIILLLKFACDEEIKINRQFAPQIYRRVVPITQSADGSLTIDGDDTPVEFRFASVE